MIFYCRVLADARLPSWSPVCGADDRPATPDCARAVTILFRRLRDALEYSNEPGMTSPMSYDLAVFVPRADLRDRHAFEEWWDVADEYEGDTNDPTRAAPALQTWFHEMRKTYEPLNGPHASSSNDVELTRMADC